MKTILSRCLAILAAMLLSADGSIGQSSKTLTTAKGAITNGTFQALEDVETLRVMSSGPDDGHLLPFVTFNSDIHMANTFFDEPLRVLRRDEIKCAEPWFGRALACKSTTPTVVVAAVVTQPMSVIYRYWLDELSKDFMKYKHESLSNCRGTDNCKKVEEFVQQGESASQDDDSLWMRLKTAYCNEVPEGRYPVLNGTVQNCNPPAAQ